MNIFLIFAILDLFRNYYLTGRIFMTRIWLQLLIGAVVIWLIVRSIHKYTRWLEVEGR